MIRLERAKLGITDGVSLIHAQGTPAMPFDGRTCDLRSPCGTTMCIGSHLSLLVQNDRDEPAPIELQIVGTAVDGPVHVPTEPAPHVGHSVVHGLLAQEVTYDPEPLGPAAPLCDADQFEEAVARPKRPPT